MGTPEIASGVLESVLAMRQNHPELEVVGVFTQPDKPVGRKQILTPPAVKVTAQAAGIPVYQPKRIKRPSQVEILKSLEPDLILVTAYGQFRDSAASTCMRRSCRNTAEPRRSTGSS